MSISKFCAVAYGDINAVIGEDEGRVGGRELGVGHCECMSNRCAACRVGGEVAE
jgi:hypothetical protein